MSNTDHVMIEGRKFFIDKNIMSISVMSEIKRYMTSNIDRVSGYLKKGMDQVKRELTNVLIDYNPNISIYIENQNKLYTFNISLNSNTVDVTENVHDILRDKICASYAIR